MLQQLQPSLRARVQCQSYNALVNEDGMMYLSRLLIISLLILACIAPLTARTAQLPSGCMYIRELPLRSMLKNPFPHPFQFAEVPFPQDRISLNPITLLPHIRVDDRPMGSANEVSPRTTTGTESLTVVCGLHPENFRR